jgi:hypothetical protein
VQVPYLDCGDQLCFTDGWDVAEDAVPLLEEALRTVSLKAAAFALTEDEETGRAADGSCQPAQPSISS